LIQRITPVFADELTPSLIGAENWQS